jgi:hypothetical protein
MVSLTESGLAVAGVCAGIAPIKLYTMLARLDAESGYVAWNIRFLCELYGRKLNSSAATAIKIQFID